MSVCSRMEGSTTTLVIKIRHLACLAVSLPLFSFLFCLSYSCTHNLSQVLRSHCNVWNIAPSISASIGEYSPQKEVWNTSIILHTLPRLVLCWAYTVKVDSLMIRLDYVDTIANIACIANMMELFSLLLLSLVSSEENLKIHKIAFGLFLSSSCIYFLATFYLYGYCRRTQKQSTDFQSLHYKKVLLVTNFTAILVSMYCYWRHNTYCEPGMYSIFSLFEYTVVLSNMAYHFTSYYDFYNTTVTLGSNNQVTSDIRQE